MATQTEAQRQAADAKAAEAMRAQRVQDLLTQKDAGRKVRARWGAVGARIA